MHVNRRVSLSSRARATLRTRGRADGGFAMIIALVILVVAMLLAAAAFSAVQEDTKNTRTYIVQQKAYAAALAGIQSFKYELGANNNYWATCPKTAAPATVPGTTDEAYTYRFLHSEKHTQKECEEKKQAAMIETSGSANGTFRVEATGRVAGNCGEKVLTEKGFTENAKNKYCTRSVVATFTHPGFINYVFVSNYEILDPVAKSPHPVDCEEYYKERKAKKVHVSEGGDCQQIVWAAHRQSEGTVPHERQRRHHSGRHVRPRRAQRRDRDEPGPLRRRPEIQRQRLHRSSGHAASAGNGPELLESAEPATSSKAGPRFSSKKAARTK